VSLWSVSLSYREADLNLPPMPRHGKGGKKKSGKQSGGRPVLDVSGVLRRMGIPIPSLPFLIGSATSLSKTGDQYPVVTMDIPIIPQFAGIVAGGLTTVMAIDATALLENWAALSALFAEFCVLGARLELRMNNVGTPSGLVIAYIDERSNAAPTIATAASLPHLELVVSQTESPSRHLISWMPNSTFELEFTQTSVAAINSWLKLFAAVASTGTAAGTTGQVSITGALRVRFCGFI